MTIIFTELLMKLHYRRDKGVITLSPDSLRFTKTLTMLRIAFLIKIREEALGIRSNIVSAFLQVSVTL